MILFPCGMLTSMSADEVEAILVHELAHIRRHDFAVNMLQNIVEIIFFFNPAVLWVSSLVKAERENCCDDIAVSHSCNKRLYINALMTFGQVYEYRPPVLANALGGNTNQLMHRIKRIIYNDNKTLNNMEKKFLAAGIILTCVFAFAFSPDIAQQKQADTNKVIPDNDNAVSKEKSIDPVAATDTVPIAKEAAKDIHTEMIQTSVNGKEYKIVTQNGEVDALYVDGKKVPADKTRDYKEVTDGIISQMQIDGKEAKEEMQRSQKDRAKAEEDQKNMAREMKERAHKMEQAKKEMNEHLQEQKRELENAKLDFERSQEMALNNELTRKKIEQEKKEMELYNEKLKKEMELSRKDMMLQNEKARKEMEQSQRDMALNKEKAAKEMEKSQQDMALYKEKAMKEIEQSHENIARNKENMQKEMEESKLRMAQAQKDMEQAKATQKEIISDLIKEHIIQMK